MTLSRPASAAGTWYPEDGDLLLRLVENMMIEFRPADDATCDASMVLLPHNAFAYASECVCRTLAQIEIPDRVLIIHTRHSASPLGPTLAPFDTWQTPVAASEGAKDLNQALLELEIATLDENTHLEDHAAEVLLPYFQVLNRDVQVAAISMPPLSDQDTLAFGDKLAALLKDYPEDMLIVLASDLNHYADRRTTERLDDLILERIEFMDAEGLLEVAKNEELNFFGASQIAAGLRAAKGIGCDEVLIVHHTDSGESEGQIDEVIGFASGFLR